MIESSAESLGLLASKFRTLFGQDTGCCALCTVVAEKRAKPTHTGRYMALELGERLDLFACRGVQ